MFYSFNDPNAPTTKQLQYFEMLGNPPHLIKRLEGSHIPWPAALGE
jgi:hypothetical protein